MKSNHEKIKEMLPEYLRNAVSKELKADIKAHLKKCKDCKEEMGLIKEFIKDETPDPGDLFYNTLSQKVRLTLAKYQNCSWLAEQNKSRFSLRSFFFRPLPIAIAAAVLILFVFTFKKNGRIKELDPFFKDPFAVSFLDYSDISEKDIISKELAIDDKYVYEDFMGYSHVREFAYMDSKEIDKLYETLKKGQKTGGSKI